jgi:hypothetical protein
LRRKTSVKQQVAAQGKYFVLVLALSGVVAYYITKSPKYLDDLNRNQEKIMNTTLSTKLTALVLALAINSVIMGSVALVFSTHAHALSSVGVVALIQHSDRAA